jgi:hypothetical protein
MLAAVKAPSIGCEVAGRNVTCFLAIVGWWFTTWDQPFNSEKMDSME